MFEKTGRIATISPLIVAFNPLKTGISSHRAVATRHVRCRRHGLRCARKQKATGAPAAMAFFARSARGERRTPRERDDSSASRRTSTRGHGLAPARTRSSRRDGAVVERLAHHSIVAIRWGVERGEGRAAASAFWSSRVAASRLDGKADSAALWADPWHPERDGENAPGGAPRVATKKRRCRWTFLERFEGPGGAPAAQRGGCCRPSRATRVRAADPQGVRQSCLSSIFKFSDGTALQRRATMMPAAASFEARSRLAETP